MKRILLMCLPAMFVLACDFSGLGGRESSSGTVSGRVTASTDTAVDSDVNDVNSPYTENDSFASAQLIANPVTVGGYVNTPGSGNDGRSFENGDVNDYFFADLLGGQTVSLLIGSDEIIVPDLDLFLYDESERFIAESVRVDGNEVVTVPGDGKYYIIVRAISGGGNYLLTMALNNFSVTSSDVAGKSNNVDVANKSTLAGVQSSTSQKDSSDTFLAGADFVPGEVIVQFNQPPLVTPDANNSKNLMVSAVGMTIRSGNPGRSMLLGIDSVSSTNTFSALSIQHSDISTSGDISVAGNIEQQSRLDTIAVLQALRKRSDVYSARLNYIRKPLRIPNDTLYSSQWNLPQINLPQAWDITTGAPEVIVAVIDTGILQDHPDLSGKLVAGYDFISSTQKAGDGDGLDDNPEDVGDGSVDSRTFHGTHVAGIIAASSNNNRGVAGVAWDTRIMPLRALGGIDSGGTDYDIEQAVLYAAGLPNDAETSQQTQSRVAAGLVADIINLSLGGPAESQTPPQAYIDAREAGVIIVAAAGNEPTGGLTAPAALDGVVSVSATDMGGLRAFLYSNFGSTIDVAAPGGGPTESDGVYSAWGEETGATIQYIYRRSQGTSMASPHVAGVAALMKSLYPNMTPDNFDQYLADGRLTNDAGETGRDDLYGYGVIDAFKAVQTAVNAEAGILAPVPARLEVEPRSLDFSHNTNSLEIMLKNGGDESLTVSGVIIDAASTWLSVDPVNVDGDGLGTYRVTVNRNGLDANTLTWSDSIALNSSANNTTLPVIMQLDNPAFGSTTGVLFGNLYDISSDGAVVYPVNIGPSVNGVYSYELRNVPPGYYYLRVGTDLNNDRNICGSAEASGAYRIAGSPTAIIINGRGGVVGGTNFESGYNLYNPGLYSTSRLSATSALDESGYGCQIYKPDP